MESILSGELGNQCQELVELCNNNGKINSKRHNYLSTLPSPVKYEIHSHNLGNFWQGYCDLVRINEDDTRNLLSLHQKVVDFFPLSIDGKLSFDSLTEGMQLGADFTDNIDTFIQEICKVYQNVLEEDFELGTNKAELTVCILRDLGGKWEENEQGEATDIYAIRFALHFPTAVLLHTNQENVQQKVYKLLRRDNILRTLDRQPVGDWKDILKIRKLVTEEENVYTPLFGSIEKLEDTPLHLENIYTAENFTTEGSELYQLESGTAILETELEYVFSPVEHSDVSNRYVQYSRFDDLEDLHFWLPMYLSSNYCGVCTNPKSKGEALLLSRNSISSDESSVGSLDEEGEEVDPEEPEINLVLRFLRMINMKKRMNKQNFWEDIGKVLYNSTVDSIGEDKGLLLWEQFTEKYSYEFDSDDCSAYYDDYETDNYLTWKTLAFYAEQDNPKVYEEWHDNWAQASMYEAIKSCSHADIAHAFYRQFFNKFISSADGDKKVWYVFDRHSLRRVRNLVEVRHHLGGRKIKDNLRNKFEDLHRSFTIQMGAATDVQEKSKFEKLVELSFKVMKKLSDDSFKNRVTNEIYDEFYDPYFDKKMDHLPLIGCRNGVIESGIKQAYPRAGKPEDFVTKTSYNNYPFEMTDDDPKWKELWMVVHQFFPYEELHDYQWKVVGASTKKGNNDRIAPFFEGKKGANGKSIYKKLNKQALGEYCVTLDEAIFTKERSGSGPDPALEMARGSLQAWVQETKKKDKLNEDKIKAFTGGDEYFSRGCNSDGGNRIATFMLMWQCNSVPENDNPDDAMYDRMAIIPCLSQFVKRDVWENLSEEEMRKKNYFKRDTNFGRRIPKLGPAMLRYLVLGYNKYCQEGLYMPKIVKEYTQKYWERTDVYQRFKRDCLEKVTDENGDPVLTSYITEMELWLEYVNWFEQRKPNEKVGEMTHFIEAISSRIGESDRGKWGGVCIRPPERPRLLYDN